MYRTLDLAMFALSEFERGLDGLTDKEASVRMKKADGSEMNAIAWTAAHIAGHWLHSPAHLLRYRWGSSDPTPPAVSDARQMLAEARQYASGWLGRADAALMVKVPEGTGGETVGTSLMRVTLHTWFHAGEINAIRQMLGHAEIPFVGTMLGNLEWHPE